MLSRLVTWLPSSRNPSSRSTHVLPKWSATVVAVVVDGAVVVVAVVVAAVVAAAAALPPPTLLPLATVAGKPRSSTLN